MGKNQRIAAAEQLRDYQIRCIQEQCEAEKKEADDLFAVRVADRGSWGFFLRFASRTVGPLRSEIGHGVGHAADDRDRTADAASRVRGLRR
jgi:hypothetical protein